MAERRVTLAEAATTNLRAGGASWPKAMVKAGQACSTVYAWWRAADELGDWPTYVEYAAYWKISERTVYRELDVFRLAFPTEADTRRLAELVGSEIELHSAAAAMSAPAPRELVAG
jgi:hypothetical protein